MLVHELVGKAIAPRPTLFLPAMISTVLEMLLSTCTIIFLSPVRQVGVPILEKALLSTSIPDISGKAGTPIGDVDYSLTKWVFVCFFWVVLTCANACIFGSDFVCVQNNVCVFILRLHALTVITVFASMKILKMAELYIGPSQYSVTIDTSSSLCFLTIYSRNSLLWTPLGHWRKCSS